MNRRLDELEQRVSTLEAEEEANQPRGWWAQYVESLSEDEFEVEADWLIPSILNHHVGGGSPGYPAAEGLAGRPDFSPLWRAWHAAYHRVALKRSPGDLYDLWTPREDADQEHLREEIVERLLVLLPESVREFLTEWTPSNPAVCTSRPSAAYFRWRDNQANATNRD